MYDYFFVYANIPPKTSVTNPDSHVVYTIPIAALLTVVLWPLFTRLDIYKICFLITVAVIWTTPWDSYLIHRGIWTYPPDAILGPTLFRIPLEELFFFCIQTYIGTCLHILFNKPALFATYLHDDSDLRIQANKDLHYRKRLGQIFFAFGTVVPLLDQGGKTDGTYMRLISMWASPVLLLLWSLSYQLLLRLPRSQVTLPITIPTLYLWLVDTIALRRGTWSISSGTKLGVQVWPHLDIEEAVFFLATNALVVCGSCAFDNAIAILDLFPNLFPNVPSMPSPVLLVQALLKPTAEYDTARIKGLQIALDVLARKSRSFYLASGVFCGRLRIDLVLLYAYCRVADDLVDHAASPEQAEKWIKHLTHFLDTAYSKKRTEEKFQAALAPFPPEAQSVLSLLPTDRLPPTPLYSLLDGFRTDLKFFKVNNVKSTSTRPPITTLQDLEKYATQVASTVAELCLHLVYFHNTSASTVSAAEKSECLVAGARMGVALQYINIVRDVYTDADVGRSYIPSEWFDMTAGPEALVVEINQHRKRILDLAFELYDDNRDAIERLPGYAKDGIRVAVESYVEIGRVMRTRLDRGERLESMAGGGKSGRASVPAIRRLWVGWQAMSGWRGRGRDNNSR